MGCNVSSPAVANNVESSERRGAACPSPAPSDGPPAVAATPPPGASSHPTPPPSPGATTLVLRRVLNPIPGDLEHYNAIIREAELEEEQEQKAAQAADVSSISIHEVPDLFDEVERRVSGGKHSPQPQLQPSSPVRSAPPANPRRALSGFSHFPFVPASPRGCSFSRNESPTASTSPSESNGPPVQSHATALPRPLGICGAAPRRSVLRRSSSASPTGTPSTSSNSLAIDGAPVDGSSAIDTIPRQSNASTTTPINLPSSQLCSIDASRGNSQSMGCRKRVTFVAASDVDKSAPMLKK